MALLNTRGTLVRDRLDFFETSNAWAFVFGSVASGAFAAFLNNNSTGHTQLDVYGMLWFSSIAQVWDVTLHPPIQTFTPVTPTESMILCIQPDLPAPAGFIGLASAFNSPSYYRILRQSGGAQSGTLDLGYGTAHTVLPPGWSLVLSTTATAAVELSVTFYYQQVTDNVAQAK